MKKPRVILVSVVALAAIVVSLPARPQTGPAPAIPFSSDAGFTEYSKWSQQPLEPKRPVYPAYPQSTSIRQN
jgi:hypothetical protein